MVAAFGTTQFGMERSIIPLLPRYGFCDGPSFPSCHSFFPSLITNPIIKMKRDSDIHFTV